MKLTVPRIVWALLLAVIFACIGWRKTAPAWEGYYWGKLADGRAISFDLHIEQETNLVCQLHIEGTAIFPMINSPFISDKQFSIIEDTNYGEGLITGLRGTISNDPPVITGLLFTTNAAEGISLMATNIAARETLDQKRSIKFLGHGAGNEYHAAWPRFRTNDFLMVSSKMLETETYRMAQDFTSNGYDNAWDDIKQFCRNREWEYCWEANDNYQISWISLHLVSIFQDFGEYSGGAHPNTELSSTNLISSGNASQGLILRQFFKSNSGWEKELCGICERDLRIQRSSCGVNDPAVTLTTNDVSIFTFDGRGLAIHFPTYAVGSYVEGSYHVFISWNKLRPLLDTNGPARFIPGAL